MTDDTPRNPLLVSEADRRLLRAWPLELRALFDPQADRELTARIEQAGKRPSPWPDPEPPF